MTETFAVVEADAGVIAKVPNWYGDIEGEDVILPPLFIPSIMEICEYNNEKYDDGNIYNNGVDDYIPNHNYCVKDGSLSGMVSGEV